MNYRNRHRPRCFVLALLLLTAGCAQVRDRDLAALKPSIPAVPSTEMTAGSASSAPTPTGPMLQSVAYAQPAPQPVPPLNSVASNTSDTQPRVSLQEIEQFALANNPAIAAANAASNRASGLFNQVGTRANPIAGYFGSQIADAGTDQHGAYIEQEFVRGQKLKLNRQVLSHTSSAQRWEIEVQRNKVLTDVRMRFYEAAAAQLKLAAIEDFSKIASRGVEVADARFKAEEASKVELLQAKTMYSELDLSRQKTEAAYRGAWKDLAAVAGMPDSKPLPLAAVFSTPAETRDWEQTFAELVATSPEMSVANELVCEKRANLNRQKAQPTPNITAQFGAGYDNATKVGLINLQIGAPIPVANRNSGNIAAAYASYVQAVENVKRIELAIRSRLARVAQEYESALAAVHKYEQEILPQAGESLTLSEEAYEAGEFDFLQVLVVRRRFFDSRIAYVQAQAELAQAEAKIEGLLLSGGLDAPQDYTMSGDSLRGQSFGGQ